jgi:predicted outer membrane repeat protein
MRAAAFLAGISSVFFPLIAHADPYELSDGVLIAHAPPGLEFSASPPPEGWCQHYLDGFAIDRCADQHPRVDGPPAPTGVVWYVLAAWEEPKVMIGFEFGFSEYDPALFSFVDWGFCSQGGAIQLPFGGWPGPQAGTMVAAIGDESWSGNLLPIYYFAGYAYSQGVLPLGVNPRTGTALFAAAHPGSAVIDSYDVLCLGSLGLFTNGVSCYPEPGLEPRACCLGDECQELTETECLDQSGVWLYAPTCDPQTCPALAACCVGDLCALAQVEECDAAGGVWHLGAQSCVPSPCVVQTYMLRPDGTGDLPTIQSAVDAANPGDEIVLADGIYSGFGNRDVNLRGKALTIRSQSANPGSCVIDCGGGAADRHRAFVCQSGEGPDTRLEGLRVIGGHAVVGGAIVCEGGASPTIDNCVFSVNKSLNSGGAIACLRRSVPVLYNCRFYGNVAPNHGGGIWCESGGGVQLSDCGFEFNQGISEGGGLYVSRESRAAVRGCEFVANKAAVGGGVACDLEGQFDAESSSFRGNAAVLSGGGLSVRLSQCTLTGVCFSGNHASIGGGFSRTAGATRLDQVLFVENSADDRGGGILCKGSPDSFVASGVTFLRNAAVSGGGFCNAGAGTPEFSQCIWIGNTAQAGGAVYCQALTGTHLRESTLRGNNATRGAGIYMDGHSALSLVKTILAFGRGGEAIYHEAEVEIDSLACCDVFGNSGGDWTGLLEPFLGLDGNISADPLFCEAATPAEACGIHATSPCAPEQNPECGLIGAGPVTCGGASGPDGNATTIADDAGLRLAPACPVAGPNPFCRQTQIRFVVPFAGRDQRVTLHLLDVEGRVVRSLVDEVMSTGIYTVVWDGLSADGTPACTGLYYARLQTDAGTKVGTILMTR